MGSGRQPQRPKPDFQGLGKNSAVRRSGCERTSFISFFSNSQEPSGLGPFPARLLAKGSAHLALVWGSARALLPIVTFQGKEELVLGFRGH